MVKVNGVDTEAAGMSLEDLLKNQGYDKNRVAVGINEQVVGKEDYASVILKNSDAVEIVHFMGGGSRDPLVLGSRSFGSRFILGSGKYSLALIKAAVENAGAEMITVALRRANTGGRENILDYIPQGITLLPNTSGARTAQEAVTIARLARELCGGDFVKIEVIRDSKYLLPDNSETLRATEILAKEGFIVMPYMFPDLNIARDLANAGAACVMPLAAPIGTNRGLCARDFIRILLDEIDLPVIIDAGIGKPSQACEVMEMGAAAVMANTAIATARDIPAMAEAFKKAIEAGRSAFLAGPGRVLEKGAVSSSPLTGFLRDREAAGGDGGSRE
ncbi:MAG: sulfur carrier protein ThiS [Treponema sp.]|jgi:thiazole synthase|nr:sulfur carrier protein ThiS [Treponema sp.]